MTYCSKCGNAFPEDALYCSNCGTAVTAEKSPTSSTEPSGLASEVKLAFWGERFLAWLIDSIIIGLIVGVVSAFTWFATTPFSFLPSWLNWIPFFNLSVNSIIIFLYWMFMDGAYGQSLGKMVMRLRVTRLDGKPISMGQAAVESLGKAFFLPLDFLIGVFLYAKRRQRVFSFLSETIVIRER